MQRLFSTFANGLPGKGLLILRLVLGTYLIQTCLTIDPSDGGVPHLIFRLISGASGILVLAGLWTPVAGVLCGFAELWAATSLLADPWAPVLAAALGAGLALIGPGAHSVDAHIYGRRRISGGIR